MLHPFDPADPSSTPDPAQLAAAGFHPGHVVQFYESDAFLTAVIVDFIAVGLAAGQPALVIATAPHRAALAEGLTDRGLDVDALVRTGRLTVLDARETLASFMTGTLPDPALFKQAIDGMTRSTAHAGRYCTRAYGEMVDVLWKDGNTAGALALEKLWNELDIDHPLALLCAHSLAHFYKETHGAHFEAVLKAHGHVVPSETYVRADPDARLRQIAWLQQRAQALDHELQYRRELEEALRSALARTESARSEAEQAGRLKDDFLAILSHELRTPLNAILGWAQIMRTENVDPDTLSRGLDVILRNAELQTRLIEDLLDVSRIIRGELTIASEAVDLGATATAAAESVRPASAAKGIDLQVHVDPAGPIVTGDAVRLRQVIWNLLSNAVKFTPSQGSVTLTVERAGPDARIVVRDSGAGIPAEFLPHVFDRFKQADNSTTRRFGGLGLGLAVVRHLAEAHGGTVSAQSEGPGRGSTFTVSLPAGPKAARPGLRGQTAVVATEDAPQTRGT